MADAGILITDAPLKMCSTGPSVRTAMIQASFLHIHIPIWASMLLLERTSHCFSILHLTNGLELAGLFLEQLSGEKRASLKALEKKSTPSLQLSQWKVYIYGIYEYQDKEYNVTAKCRRLSFNRLTWTLNPHYNLKQDFWFVTICLMRLWQLGLCRVGPLSSRCHAHG